MARIMASIFILCTLCFYVSGQVPKGRIIFSSTIANDKNPTAQLFEINSDGTGEHRITFTNKENDLPGYFHNRIVYRQKSGSTSIASILITGIDSGVVKPLIKDKLVCNPKWRGDGKLIAYEYYTNKQQQIWVMDSNGHNKKMLITNARHPNWSNDNTKIVFTRNYEVYLMNIKTGIQK